MTEISKLHITYLYLYLYPHSFSTLDAMENRH